MSNSFYTSAELLDLGLKAVGKEVFISRKTSLYNPEAITIGNCVRIDDFCVLAGGAGIVIGNFIHVGCYSALYGGSGIIMKDFCGLSARGTIYSESDDYSGHSLTNPMIPDRFKPKLHKGQVVLGRHSIVGAGTTILPGVQLGDGVSIGAHSLVTKDCDEWTIYSGAPAKRLKKRSDRLLAFEKQFIQEWNARQNVPADG